MAFIKKGKKEGGLFQMNHALGQNMLKSKNVVTQIVEHGEIQPSDIILEIGPGVGNMTQVMLQKARKVFAVEKDPRMVVELYKKFPKTQFPNLEIVQADILQCQLPDFDLCISNIPYNISSAIVFKLLGKPTFRRAVLMVQKEFAQRISAHPRSEGWGRLAINTQLYATVQQVMSVSRKNFVPAPEVDSAVITIQPRNPQPNIDFPEWDGLIKLCFQRPHRTLHATFAKKKILALLDQNRNNYLAQLGRAPEQEIGVFVNGVLENIQLSESRPIDLDIEDFYKLLQAFNEGGLHFQ